MHGGAAVVRWSPCRPCIKLARTVLILVVVAVLAVLAMAVLVVVVVVTGVPSGAYRANMTLKSARKLYRVAQAHGQATRMLTLRLSGTGSSGAAQPCP
jgi:hypothetical protein